MSAQQQSWASLKIGIVVLIGLVGVAVLFAAVAGKPGTPAF